MREKNWGGDDNNSYCRDVERERGRDGVGERGRVRERQRDGERRNRSGDIEM